MKTLFRKTYYIEGIIQGVGFRPTLYCYAVDSGLGGWIRNCSGKVELALEGTEEETELFIQNLKNNLPKQARVDKLTFVSSEIINEKSSFKILESERDSESKISIPADLAMCEDCEREILNSEDRRYGYAFTTCINCGPRYTVVNSMPYDRCRTTLNEFPLCPECEKEYTDPRNRRFHAESTACSVCGPKLWIADQNGSEVKTANPIVFAAEQIKNGKIAAIRGIGGYLLAADSFNLKTLQELRNRKARPDKPFAVMAKNIDTIKKYCHISDLEISVLKSSVSPIVILDVKNFNIPIKLLSPDTDTLGVMLPYTPLHKLLFEASDFELLIMTSGNRGGEPICTKNEEAFERLNGIADFYLCHNREINLRNDDSLCVVQNGEIQVWRRARGYAPDSVKLNLKTEQTVLSMGAELKNTICVLSGDEAVLSPHIGDLETPEAIEGLQQVVDCFPEFLNKKPDIMSIDKHPDMHSTRIGRKTAEKLGVKCVEIQHHFAHAVSCMAENNLDEALCLVFDGTGLGDDGNIWGAELLYCKLKETLDLQKIEGERDKDLATDKDNDKDKDSNLNKFCRLASFEPAVLPGGDAAVYHPVRQLIARLLCAGIEPDQSFLNDFKVTDSEYKIWEIQIRRKINSPLTHAAGRLFDAFAVLLKIAPDKITYEGQGAIRLEAFSKRGENKSYKSDFLKYKINIHNNMLFIDWNDMFADLFKKKVWLYSDEEKEKLAYTFHQTVADAACEMVKFGRKYADIDNICFSGGVFMNKLLTSILKNNLEGEDCKVYIHKKVPPNDGGISLGQCILAQYY